MNSKVVVSAVLASALLAPSNAIAGQDLNVSCDCSQVTKYDAKLPESHPNNLCATSAKDKKLNWVDWFLGSSSRSVQFHFVDFLELMSDERSQVNSSSVKG